MKLTPEAAARLAAAGARAKVQRDAEDAEVRAAFEQRERDRRRIAEYNRQLDAPYEAALAAKVRQREIDAEAAAAGTRAVWAERYAEQAAADVVEAEAARVRQEIRDEARARAIATGRDVSVE